MGQLAAVKDGPGTLLDSTLILWVSEFGDGARHVPKDLPVVLAGGGLRGGRHLALPGHTTNELFATLLHLFGFDDRAFGHPDPAMNRGPLPLG